MMHGQKNNIKFPDDGTYGPKHLGVTVKKVF